MSKFVPDCCVDSVLDITPELLQEHNVQALALDLDNTLAPYKHRKVKPAIAAWLASMRDQGFKLAVLSNARKERVSEFCAPLGLPYISYAQKPRLSCYERVSKLLKLPPKKIGMVGDQIFTDVYGAKRSGFFAICVKPIHLGNPLFKLRNLIEQPFLKKTP